MKINLRPAAAADEAFLRLLYDTSFPPEEQRPWPALWQPSRCGEPALLTIEADGVTAGMLSWWNLPSAVYIEHFAVSPDLRGSGIGAQALRRFIEAYCADKPLVLEVEPPLESEPVTMRRVGFYERAGLTLLPHHYIQPPYTQDLPSVELKLMSTDPTLPAQPVSTELHTKVYGVR